MGGVGFLWARYPCYLYKRLQSKECVALPWFDSRGTSLRNNFTPPGTTRGLQAQAYCSVLGGSSLLARYSCGLFKMMRPEVDFPVLPYEGTSLSASKDPTEGLCLWS